MSFTFGISRTKAFLLAALACALSANVCAAGGSEQVCADYAEEAFYTVDDMKQVSCGEVDRSGAPGKFTVSYSQHFNWCRQHSTPQARAFETKARNDAKSACLARPKNKAQKAKKDMCKAYSDKALEESNEMAELKCEERSSMWNTRYSLASNHHRDWCMNESTPQTLKFERETRTAAANACRERKMREVVCEKYATDAVQMSNAYQISRCTTEHHPTGRFDYKFQQHYNWCRNTANSYELIFSEEDARKVELYACKQRNAEKAKKSTPSNKFKTASVQQSADVDESSEEAALQVSAAVDPAVEDGSVIIVDTDEPAPKQRTQVIVIGNRYAEVPAFDEPADEGSRVGKVVKAGAAAVVVGTAAVATGAVAAKVLDYADDYKGGINKSMSGAAEALKEKLKDRLDGGGINKSASGAVEAMKEKIKDGFQGGGINKSMSGAAAALKERLKDRAASGGGITKAMSGAKEALKYKLKERVAGGGLVSKAASGFKEKVKARLTGGGGGGGLMKGMAKASGGVLRGLLRR